METIRDVVAVRGEQELFDRTAHLFERASDIACAARDLHTWATSQRQVRHGGASGAPRDLRIRKIYLPGVLLAPDAAAELAERVALGARIRITTAEINETILLDGRVAILAGDQSGGVRTYSVLTRPELVQGISSLFDAAWRSAVDLAVYDARFAELREQVPRILELLSSGCKDETAARTLGVGLRTYRRWVAELMTALGATSRFQAGARAREAGLL
ncbi:DNA-binding response regulator [Amycolatopsis sp. NPDC059027]|uniref:DNA-binding response regulator n=1 Tax=Amycolatopsis sp. NPDC059027 TaxID=3346709 RepID=UPI00366BD0B7